jgi:hypothetical protein
MWRRCVGDEVDEETTVVDAFAAAVKERVPLLAEAATPTKHGNDLCTRNDIVVCVCVTTTTSKTMMEVKLTCVGK